MVVLLGAVNVKVMLPRLVVATRDRGRIAEHCQADDSTGRFAGAGRDRRAGGNRGQRFVDAVVDRAVIEAVAAVAGVPDIGADLRGGDCRSGVGTVAGDRNRANRAWSCCWARST